MDIVLSKNGVKPLNVQYLRFLMYNIYLVGIKRIISKPNYDLPTNKFNDKGKIVKFNNNNELNNQFLN